MMNRGYREFVLSIKRLVLGQSVNGLLLLLNDLVNEYDMDTVVLIRTIHSS